VNIETRVNAEEVARRMQERGTNAVTALTGAIDYFAVFLQRYVIEEKLQGQVLQQRRGGQGLAGSIRTIDTTNQGGLVEGGVTGGGGTAYYGRYHEFGTEDPYTITPKNAQALHFFLGGKEIFTKKVIHPPIKERSFMRSSLAENKENFINKVREDLGQAVHK
jgi:HK97 gp10 family phage protein